jgi:cation transport ATPase
VPDVADVLSLASLTVLAVVGDEANDAPELAAADIG